MLCDIIYPLEELIVLARMNIAQETNLIPQHSAPMRAARRSWAFISD